MAALSLCFCSLPILGGAFSSAVVAISADYIMVEEALFSGDLSASAEKSSFMEWSSAFSATRSCFWDMVCALGCPVELD